MRHRPILLFLLLGAACGTSSREAVPPVGPSPGPSRRMAVTIDDLPVSPPSAHPIEEQEAITQKLLGVLTRERIPAIGFVNENKLEADGAVDPRRVALLQRWLDAGLELGNHTYSHPDLHRVSLQEFEDDVVRGESVTRPLVERAGRRLRYFRHPFLHTGRDLDTKRGLEEFLAGRGYRIAPVTIDNSEWVYGGAYARAHRAGDAVLQERLGASYLDYMEQVVAFYEQQSVAITGEEIPQILLIHAYALNADHLDRIIAMVRARGYRFVTLDEALAHEAYRSPDTFTGAGGITWLHRWALTRGMPGSTFAGEPVVPEWVEEASRGQAY